MDASKVVKTSQFNFDNIYTNTEPTKIKVTTKVTNLNPLPPTTSDRSRFVSISGQNKISVIYVNDKSRVLKNPSPLPGLNTNERKPVNLGLKPQSKKLPLKIPVNSPLTGKDQGPHSSQFQNRRLDLFEPKPKEFRVRTGSSQSKIYTESNSVHSSSRYHRDSSIQPEKLGSSFDTGEMNIEKVRSSDLARVNLASVIQHREGLPLLIMHFEGIIGSCCVSMKEASKEKGKDADESPGYFIRKGVKNELKHLAKKFLLVVVFPSFESRYKKVAKHLINSKFHIDGIYYSTKGEKPKKFHRIEDYMLNYNKILEDFKEKMPDRKVVLLVPMNVSPKVAKANFLLKGSPDDLQNFERTTDYEEKQFLGFFPKIKMNIVNLKIVCIPNFTLSEKNDRFSVLAKSSFSDVAKMLEHIHQEIAETILSSIIPSECKLDKSSTKHSSPSPLASVSLNQIDAKSDDGLQQIASSKETEAGSQALTEDKENRVQKKSNDVGLRPINLEPLIAGIEKVLEYNKKWQKINQLKQAASVDPLQVPSEFDLASMKQKIIESLIETQKAKGYVRGNIMHHFLVGDLFSRNNHLFRFYEKDNFYLKKAYEQVSAISMNLNTGLQASNNFESMHKRERAGFESAPLSAKTPKSRMTQSTEDELIEILLIRRQTRVMQLYLGD